MDDETNLGEGPEVEDVPAIDDEQELAEDSQATEFDEDNPEEPEPEPEPEETAEVEYDGKRYKVPKALEDAVMRQADYTRKTQEVAEQRKTLEARIASVESASAEEKAAQSELSLIDTMLGQYANVDWNALQQVDPQGAQQHTMTLLLLQEQKRQAETKLTEAASKRESEVQRINAERFETTMREAKAVIPDWGEAKATELQTFAEKQFGFTRQEFVNAALHDPRLLKLVNVAYAATKSSPKAAKQEAPAAPKPATKIRSGGSAPVRGLDDNLSAEEWTKRRNEQLRKRA